MKRRLPPLDPIVLFLVLGAALVLLHRTQEPAPDPMGPDLRIVVSEADVAWIQESFKRRWFRPPTKSELAALVDQYVKDEVLYREAVTLGLDREDAALRRRLALKLESLARDVGAAQPTDAELEAFMKKHADRYASDPRRSFEQVYVSTDKRGAAADGDARTLLEALRGEPDQDLTKVGDMLTLEIRHPLSRPADVRAQFGPQFADAIFALPVGSWEGPVRSGYGLHLVRVLKSEVSEPAKLEEVRGRVQRDLVRERKDAARDAYVQALLRKYDIQVEVELVKPGDSDQ